ncbi:MAG: 3-hydroxybutyryl-CoA dehydrogenase [Magnetococcales bacterium]|nr:3-hydroxybutyryl-CoA dehydrogenase [Magnetococcales bacterium]
MRVVGVIGAGVMGVGVAQNLAQCGMQAILIDVSEEILDRARQQIFNNIRFQGFFTKEKSASPPEEILEKITFTTDFQRLAQVDYLVENVVEKWPVKQEVYAKIDAVCPPACIFAANTSAISITRIGSATRRPDKVIGMHFMNPVPMKPTVEVIRGFHTSAETIDISKDFLKKMGKTAVVVNDSPGFVSNRVLMLTINEAVFLVHEQVAKEADVDHIFKSCFGHKMGPLELADLIGLDTILYSLDVLYESFNDPKFRPCPLLKKMVDAGLHGRKSGRGFYDYQI